MTSTTTNPLELDQQQMGDLIHKYRCELPDGREVRLVVEREDIDPMTLINDADCWGKVGWNGKDRDTGRDGRPAGFTGAARKLRIFGYVMEGIIWWEPYREGHKVYDTPDDLAAVRRLLEEGFQQVGVKLYETLTDTLGHAHKVKVAEHWLGGIDALGDGHLAEIIGDLLAELG